MNKCHVNGLFVILSLVFILILSITGCSNETPQQKETTATPTAVPVTAIELKYASDYADTHWMTVIDKKFISKIEQESKGKIHVTVYPGKTLINTKTSAEELKKGVADFGTTVVSMGTGFDFTNGIRAFFYGCPSYDVEARAYYEVLAKYPEIDSEWKDLKILLRTTTAPMQALTIKPIRTIEDFKGLKFKTAASLIDPLKLLGAEGTAMPISETYSALEKGLMDGATLPFDAVESFRLNEVIKYVTEINIFQGPWPTRSFNVDSWNKLPPDVQKVFNDNFPLWNDELNKGWETADQSGQALAKKSGVEFIKLSPDDIIKLNDAWGVSALETAKSLDAKGFPGTQVFQETRNLIEKYSQQ